MPMLTAVRHLWTMILVVSLFGGGCDSLQLSEIQKFLKSYCQALRIDNINIFLRNGRTEDPVLSAGSMRALWSGSNLSLSVRRVNTIDEVTPTVGINVWFLKEPRDLLFFTQVPDQLLIRHYLWLIFGDIREILSKASHIHLMLDNQQLPFTYLSEPDENGNVQLMGGYATDVWHTLQDVLGFKYTCRPPSDGKWGSNAQGTWNGLVKDLIDGQADVVVTALDGNKHRRGVVDFVFPLKEVGYQLIARRPKLMEQTWTSFTSEFVPGSWMATIGFALFVPPCLSLCAYLSPSENQRISIKDAYIMTVGALTTQGSWLDVRSIPTRIVFITIFFTTLLVYAHYTSALVSLLTVASTEPGFSSLRDLLDGRKMQFGFQEGISIQDEFQDAQSGLFHDVWHKLIKDDLTSLTATNAEGVDRVMNGNYAFMMEENIYTVKFFNVCGTMMVKGKYFNTYTGFAVAKGSPLQKVFNAQLIRMRDGGVLDRLWKRWQPPSALCTSDNVVALDIFQLFTAFLLLLLGIGLAIFLLPCERMYWKFFGKNASSKTFLKKSAVNRLISHGNDKSVNATDLVLTKDAWEKNYVSY